MIGNKEDPRKVFGKTISDYGIEHEDVVLLSADSGKSSGFGDFMAACPDRYFECGIMEQCVTGIAAGLACAGKIPVFCAIAPFVTARNFEMFRNDCGYMQQNVKIVGRNGGITYSDLGATHHSLDDFAIIRMIPGVTILCPQDPNEIRSATKAMMEHKGPVYMRIGNAAIENLFEEEPFEIGKGRKIADGKDVTIIATGTETGQVMKALPLLKEKDISADVIGLPTIYPLDKELILESVEKTGRVVTVEEHYVTGGLGGSVAELLCEECPAILKKIGVPHWYATSGPYDEILHQYGLDAEGIAKTVAEFTGR
ncbi:MAG: transketolase [Lachnospiraceae bacterium]|nr:transketolase [Lachnospiraceae bacterium]